MIKEILFKLMLIFIGCAMFVTLANVLYEVFV